MKNRRNKIAFTLAEILIVLSIIGLVAEATIPTLVQNYQKKITVVKLQKIYSEMSQVIKLSEVDNGPAVQWSFIGANQTETAKLFADEYFNKYIKWAKQCTTNEEGCWSQTNSITKVTNPYLNYSFVGALTGITASGYSILFWTTHNSDAWHAQIWVDIDGPYKGKSVIGKDVFNLILKNDGKIYLRGIDHTANRAQIMENCKGAPSYTSNGDPSIWTGIECSGLIQHDGWEIADDYPW